MNHQKLVLNVEMVSASSTATCLVTHFLDRRVSRIVNSLKGPDIEEHDFQIEIEIGILVKFYKYLFFVSDCSWLFWSQLSHLIWGYKVFWTLDPVQPS